MSGYHAAHRTPTAAYYTILESRTHVGWPRKNGFWFRSSYQKCVGKEKFEFSGLCGQISNFLTLFLNVRQNLSSGCKTKKIIKIENIWIFSVWLQFDKKSVCSIIWIPGNAGRVPLVPVMNRNGFGVLAQAYQVGAHLEALIKSDIA